MDIKSIHNQNITSMNSQNIEIQSYNPKTNKSSSDPIENMKNTENQNKKNISPEELKKATEDLNKKLSMLNTQLRIEIDKDTGIVVAKIIDKETKEVIRQIPPEVVLKIAKYLDEITGLLFNEKV